MVNEEVEVTPLNLTNSKKEPPKDLDTISLNGFITDTTIRKVSKISGSKGVLRTPFQWLYDLMSSENFIEIKRVIASDGRRYLVIDRITEEE